MMGFPAASAADTSRTEPHIRVSEISSIVSERWSGFTVLSLEADVTNNTDSTGDVYVTIVGRDRLGNEIDSAIIRGRIDAGGTRTLSTNTMVSDSRVFMIRTWETQSARIHRWAQEPRVRSFTKSPPMEP
jgi:hypothetical protein